MNRSPSAPLKAEVQMPLLGRKRQQVRQQQMRKHGRALLDAELVPRALPQTDANERAPNRLFRTRHNKKTAQQEMPDEAIART
jgi:hypothetical protein